MDTAAKIIELKDFAKIDFGVNKIVCASGGFDPIHPGHTNYISASKKFGDILVVIVNGDSFLVRKKGNYFLDLRSRCMTVACIKNVDFVIPFECEIDDSVNKALEIVKPSVFTNGGDRNINNIPETETCKRLGIEIVTRVGLEEVWSSTNLLKRWTDEQISSFVSAAPCSILMKKSTDCRIF